MALASISFNAPAIKKSASLTVIIPDVPPPWKTLYLLHGLSDDHTVWTRRTSIERYVQDLPLLIAMPATERQWYTNSNTPPGLPYEDHIMQDVIGFVERTFPVQPNRAGRAIGGLSMGGYGAVKLALKHPTVFASAHSHSGALMIAQAARHPEKSDRGQAFMDELVGVMGPPARARREDCELLAKKCPKPRRPALRIDCGTDDFLLQSNRDFHKILNRLQYDHEYEEFPGNHNWEYWDRHIQSALLFHRRVLQF